MAYNGRGVTSTPGPPWLRTPLTPNLKSLYSLIADGHSRATSLGRNTWKTLIGSQASLQLYCNYEGFSAFCTEFGASRARIGFVGNVENACDSCYSRIGLGTAGYSNDTNTCVNVAGYGADNNTNSSKPWANPRSERVFLCQHYHLEKGSILLLAETISSNR